tara:strand:+ start:1129 stop:1467 length:339 start_codon:yes stop_codon:yes gene_type:complete
MFRTVLTAMSLAALPAAALAVTPQETLTAACTEAGNDAEECSCAAGLITDELTEAEVNFMMAAMEAETNDPTTIMALAAEHEMSMEAIVAMGQKMGSLEPAMRDECGIEEVN